MNASGRFLANRVMTATPAQRVVMMYDRALLDVARANLAFTDGDSVAGSEQVMHAMAIVSELRSVLDVTRWDGAAQLGGLYDWLITTLIDCRSSDRDGGLERVTEILTTLRAAWQQAVEQVSGEAALAIGGAV